jgi:hypothetical protein
MTLRRGSTYGEPGRLPADGLVVDTDAGLRQIVLASRARGERPAVVGLIGGDLCRTLGGTGDADRLRSDDAMTMPVDLGVAVLDGVPTVFVAHLVTGRPFRRSFTAVMNAQWLGDLDLGPRSHPGDGLLDITTGSLGRRTRRTALRRARTGTHLPHPALTTARSTTHQFDFDDPVAVSIDGIVTGVARSILVSVEPDALTVVI